MALTGARTPPGVLPSRDLKKLMREIGPTVRIYPSLILKATWQRRIG
jgi:hypothetical protein